MIEEFKVTRSYLKEPFNYWVLYYWNSEGKLIKTRHCIDEDAQGIYINEI